MADDRELVVTKTGEIFQPIRLYYRISSKSGVRVALNKLRCVDFEPAKNYWVWVYDNEARKLDFKTSYAALHPDDKPLILGIFKLISDDQLCLDVGSVERAIAAIQFFDRAINKIVADIEYAAIYNKMPRNRHEYPGIQFDALFAGIDTDTFDHKSDQRHSNLVDALRSGNILDVLNDEGFDVIEGFRVDLGDGGIKHLYFQLMINQVVAIQRLNGDKDLKLSDFVASILELAEKKRVH